MANDENSLVSTKGNREYIDKTKCFSTCWISKE